MTTDELTPLHNQEAEEALISTVLVDSETFPDLAQTITANDFYIHRHRWIWEAFERLNANRTAIDNVSVADDLHRLGKLEEIGGAAYLTRLVMNFVTSANAEAHALIVVDYSRRRQAINLANEIANAAYKTNQPFDVSSYVPSLLQGEKLDTRRTPTDALGEIYSDLYEPSTPLTYGISDLDERLGGMFRKELTVLAGDQGTGKSALMIWAARANAKRRMKVIGVSLEMQAKSWFMRMACGDLGVNWNQVRANKVDDAIRLEVWEKAQELTEAYSNYLTIYEDPMTLQKIHAAVMRERADIVFVDHVGLIAGMKETRNGVDRIDQLNNTVRFLRQNIAKPFDCHVVLLWQLNRSAFKENRKPTKHDLYMAGTQDPDSILLLYRPDLYDQDAQTTLPTKPVDLDVIIGKARNDYTGEVALKYDLSRQAFGGLARGDMAHP